MNNSLDLDKGSGVTATTGDSNRVAIVQSSYIPWRGYFGIINSVDHFVLFDDAQYTTRDWRNRNRIRTKEGELWLSIPVKKKGLGRQKIFEVETSDATWSEKHWQSIYHSYKKAPFYEAVSKWLQPLYLDRNLALLSDINALFIKEICSYLNIKTKIVPSMDLEITGETATLRLISMVQQLGGDTYLSGPAAKDYMDESDFEQAGMKLEYIDYSAHKAYPQVHGEFVDGLSILDLLFNLGPSSKDYLIQQGL